MIVWYHLVCEPNVVQLPAHRLGDITTVHKIYVILKFTRKSTSPNPGGFGSNLDAIKTPYVIKSSTHILTCHLAHNSAYISKFHKKVQNGGGKRKN